MSHTALRLRALQDEAAVLLHDDISSMRVASERLAEDADALQGQIKDKKLSEALQVARNNFQQAQAALANALDLAPLPHEEMERRSTEAALEGGAIPLRASS